MRFSSQLYLGGADIESRGPLEPDCSRGCIYNKRLQNDRKSAMHFCPLPSVGGV